MYYKSPCNDTDGDHILMCLLTEVQ